MQEYCIIFFSGKLTTTRRRHSAVIILINNNNDDDELHSTDSLLVIITVIKDVLRRLIDNGRVSGLGGRSHCHVDPAGGDVSALVMWRKKNRQRVLAAANAGTYADVATLRRGAATAAVAAAVATLRHSTPPRNSFLLCLTFAKSKNQ